MSKQASTGTSAETYAHDLRSYAIGGVLALVLTALAFALVAFDIFATYERLAAIAGLAVIQIVVHFRYFLHISWRSHRDDLQLVLFTGMILCLMVGGTIWILYNLHQRMM